MNDFTKEELKLAHEYLCGNPRTWKLANKIQAMIDNYCEHESKIHCKCEGPWVCDDCAL